VPLATLWRAGAAIFLAIIPCAAYASVINDFADRTDDLAAAKPNRLEGRSRPAMAALLAATIGPGLFFAWHWRHDLPLFSCYAAAWATFTVYSLPPFRFKARGILGVLCDACGAVVFPIMVATIVTHRAAHATISTLWMASLTLGALAYGTRAILWHQLHDVENDRAAGVGTFAARHPRGPYVLGRYLAFPVELAALGSILWQLRSGWALGALVVYGALAVQYVRRWELRPLIVVPAPRSFMALHEFYIVFFPVAILLNAAWRDHRDLLVLGAHLIVFPAAALETARLSIKLLPPRRLRRWIRSAVDAITPRHKRPS
jgi:4-hydroxybenzoate polyprenyltransferase